MADRHINGVLYRTEKVFHGVCSCCGGDIACGWKVSDISDGNNKRVTVATYCYKCTGNNWARSFKIYRESAS
jgi:hypothetical protein